MYLIFNIIKLNKYIVNYLININKFVLDRSGKRFKQIVRLYECEKLLNQSTIHCIPEGKESNKTTKISLNYVSCISNDENFFNTPDASIYIIKLTNNEENQSKQTRNQYQQNLIQPNIVYDHSNIEKIQFPPYHSAKRLNDQQKSQPLAKRQKKFILSENKNFEKSRSKFN